MGGGVLTSCLLRLVLFSRQPEESDRPPRAPRTREKSGLPREAAVTFRARKAGLVSKASRDRSPPELAKGPLSKGAIWGLAKGPSSSARRPVRARRLGFGSAAQEAFGGFGSLPRSSLRGRPLTSGPRAAQPKPTKKKKKKILAALREDRRTSFPVRRLLRSAPGFATPPARLSFFFRRRRIAELSWAAAGAD